MFYRIIRWIFKPFISLIYPTKVLHKERFSNQSAVICCNHFASSDVLIVSTKLLKKECNVLGKAELFKKGCASWFLHKMGAIPVHRGEVDISAHREVMKRLKAGKQLLIFPEGTRNQSGTEEMADFKSGAGVFAMKAKVPIIPLIFHHKSKKFERNYLIVGNPIDISNYYGKNMHDVKEDLSTYLHAEMEKLQSELSIEVDALMGKKNGNHSRK